MRFSVSFSIIQYSVSRTCIQYTVHCTISYSVKITAFSRMLSKSPQMVTVTLLQGQHFKLSIKKCPIVSSYPSLGNAVVFSSGVTTLSSPAVDSAATATVVAVVLSVSLLLIAAILLGNLKCKLMGTWRIFLL